MGRVWLLVQKKKAQFKNVIQKDLEGGVAVVWFVKDLTVLQLMDGRQDESRKVVAVS